MKTYLAIVGGCTLMMYSCNSHSTQQEKKIVDDLLNGKEISLAEMPYYGNKDDEKYTTPWRLGSQLGYSKEDLEKLKSAVIKIPDRPQKTKE